MADNIYVFETLQAAGTTVVFDDGTGNDWIFLNGIYPEIVGHAGPSSTLQLNDPVYGVVAYVTVYLSPTTHYSITFKGGIENIRGSGGFDYMTGSDGANILVGDPTDVWGGNDWLIGGGGNDTLIGVGASDILWGGDGDDLLYGDNDPFSQDQGNFASGDDSLRGDNGNDTLFGGFGVNSLDGGADNDTADYSGFFDDFGNFSYAVIGNLTTGIVTVTETDLYTGDKTVVATDSLISIECLVGSNGNDVLTGQSGAGLPTNTYDQLDGGAGNDFIYGGSYLDIIIGGDGEDWMSDGGNLAPPGGGNDAMYGGAGNDFYYLAGSNTVVVELLTGGTDLVASQFSYTLTANVENLTLLGVASALVGNGNSLGNVIWGNEFSNTLNGLNGSDQLQGQAGDDTLRGDAGYDQLTGGAGNDRLFGGADDDTLSGGGQDDRLQGGTGCDRLTGGLGRDMFIFASADEAGFGATRDTITDFRSGTDMLDLHKIAAGQSFVDAARFSRIAGEIRFDAARGVLMGDLDGDRVADWQILLQGVKSLLESDLIL